LEIAACDDNIADLSDLAPLATLVNGGLDCAGATFQMTTNIAITNDYDTGDGNWKCIGNEDTFRFAGTFDGHGYTVSGLQVNLGGLSIGLFGTVDSGGTIQNVGVSGAVSNGGIGAGGVVGENLGTVQNCYNAATISGSQYIGGVVGYNNGGTVRNCYNAGAVSGVFYVPVYALTIDGGGTGATEDDIYAAGAVSINAGTKAGFSFNGWTTVSGSGSFTDASLASTTFTMPASPVTITAAGRRKQPFPSQKQHRPFHTMARRKPLQSAARPIRVMQLPTIRAPAI